MFGSLSPAGARHGLPSPRRLFAGLIVVSAALRIIVFAERRSLWLDEARLALNIIWRGYIGLLRPLDDGQYAPWLFLWVERLAVAVLGRSELTLRFFPLLCGLVLPIAVWRLRCELLEDDASIGWAVALAGLSPGLVFYANELKPYSSDALVSVLLLTVSLHTLKRPRETSAWLALCLAGAVALSISFPATFVAAGCAVALWSRRDIRSDGRARRWFAFCGIAWALCFSVPYLLLLRASARGAYLQSAFDTQFLALGSFAGWSRALSAWIEFSSWIVLGPAAGRERLTVGLGIAGSVALASLIVLGLRRLSMRPDRSVALLVVGPIVAGLVASLLRLYPLTPRLWLFAVPLFFILAEAGAKHLVDTRIRLVRGFGLVAVWSLIATSAGGSLWLLMRPYAYRENVRPLIEALAQRLVESGEPVYVSASGVPQWLFYVTARTSANSVPTNRDSATTWIEQTTCGSRRAGLRSSAAPPCQLLGRYSGMSYVEGSGFGGSISPGWAAAEVRRLHSAAKPCGWMLLHHAFPGEPGALAAALVQLGGDVESALQDRTPGSSDASSIAFRVCFRTS